MSDQDRDQADDQDRATEEPGVLSEDEHVEQRKDARAYAEQVVAEATED